MGIVFSSLFALGVFLFTKVDTGMHLDHVLFGDLLGVSWTDVLAAATLLVPAFVIVITFRRDLMLFAFDPQHAGVIGLNTRLLQYGLLALLSLVIVAAIKAVGIVLVIAMLIAPGATAWLLTQRFDAMLFTATGFALFSTIMGVAFSYYIDSAPAPTIVVLMTLQFVLAFLFAPGRGILVTSR